MQFFLNCELEAGEGEKVVFTDALVSTYEEPTELTKLADEPLAEATRDRINFIRNIPTRSVA